MGTSARVTSIEAVSRFRQTLASFTDEIAGALFSLRAEIAKTQDWLEHDCPHYWREQTRVAFDRIASARSNLETAQMRGKVAGHRPTCYDEQVALRKAKQRLQFAQDQIDVARRWGNKFRHEAEEYKGCLGKLQYLLDHDLVVLQSKLDGMIRSLEEYLEGQPAEAAPSPISPLKISNTNPDVKRPTNSDASSVSSLAEENGADDEEHADEKADEPDAAAKED